MKRIARAVVVLLAIAAGGCVTQPMGTPQPSLTTLEKIRTLDIATMRVGGFTAAPAIAGTKDKSMGIRALTLVSPVDKSFAKYLGKTFEVNLKAAGKLDANASLVLEGILTDADVDCGINTGRAKLSARLSVLKNGTSVFTKDLAVDDTWPGHFIGAEAIPEAANHFTALFDQLTVKLVTDSDFLSAVKK